MLRVPKSRLRANAGQRVLISKSRYTALYQMSPCPPVGDIKLSVPRHNSQRIGSKLKAEVEKAAKVEGKRADATQPSHDTAIAQAIVSVRVS